MYFIVDHHHNDCTKLCKVNTINVKRNLLTQTVLKNYLNHQSIRSIVICTALSSVSSVQLQFHYSIAEKRNRKDTQKTNEYLFQLLPKLPKILRNGQQIPFLTVEIRPAFSLGVMGKAERNPTKRRGYNKTLLIIDY